VTNIIYNYLPSFYQNVLVDSDGSPILDPLFNNYANCMGDAYYQALQISKVPYLESAPLFFKETYKSIDTKSSNKYNNGYKIDNAIIYFNKIYLDGLFTTAYNGSWKIYHDIENDIRYIVFFNLSNNPVFLNQDYMFVDYCYNDLKSLQNTYGFLLQHIKNIPDYNNQSSPLLINFSDINLKYIQYKNELLGILYLRMFGPTIKALNTMAGLFIGLPYSTVDGIIRSKDSTNLYVQDNITGKIIQFTIDATSNYSIGQKISKYDILQNSLPYRIYDLFGNPARFTQILISGYMSKVLKYLTLSYSDNEKDASLNYDSLINWDDSNIFWDMGNNTGTDLSIPFDIVAPDVLAYYDNNLTQFNTWYDSRFGSNPTDVIYEMFRNIFILEQHDSSIISDTLMGFINSIIPIYTKCILY